MEHNPLNTAPLPADLVADPRRSYIAPTITNLSQTTSHGKITFTAEITGLFAYAPS